MQTTYCSHCGSKNIYSGEKPKFCSSCGKPMGGSEASKKTATSQRAKARRNKAPEEKSSIDDGSTDIDYVPNIESLSYEIDSDVVGYQTYSLGDLIDAGKTEEAQKGKRRA